MTPIIEVENLVKRYKKAGFNAVDGVSFQARQGEFFALLGPNGAGKTTTISVLTTTLLPTQGAVRIAGYDVVGQASAVRQQIGIIFQKPSLDLNLTAEENVRMHAVLYGLYGFRPAYSLMPSAYKEKIDELARLLGISQELFRPVKTFSGGMKRKLEIIRSLIHNPQVLFLDEPTTGLDPVSRRNLWDYLRKVRAESGTTIFLTTHYLDEAEQADTICIIDRGKVMSYGDPAELKAQYTAEYVVIDAADRAALRDELQRKAFSFSENPAFHIQVNGKSVHQIVKSIDTPLTQIQPHSQTLEDVYLAIVEKSSLQGASDAS